MISPAWKMVFALMFVQTVSSGFGFYNMSVYVTVLAAEMQESVAALSLAVSLFFFAGGITGIYVARLIDRVDVRWIMGLGTLLAGASLAGVGYSEDLWVIYALFVLFGMGNTGVSLVVGTTLITRWFPGSNRSVALSIASTGLSLGGVTLAPLTAYLFNQLGVAATMPWVGVGFVVLILPVALLVLRMPGETDVRQPALVSMNYAHAIRQRFFVLVSLGFVVCMAGQVGSIAHLYGRVEQLADYTVASYALQILSVCSILGRFAGGVVAAKVPIK